MSIQTESGNFIESIISVLVNSWVSSQDIVLVVYLYKLDELRGNESYDMVCVYVLYCSSLDISAGLSRTFRKGEIIFMILFRNVYSPLKMLFNTTTIEDISTSG